MFGANWRSPGFWKWWWRYGASRGQRGLAVAALLALLLAGGWFGSVYLTTAGANDSVVLETTSAHAVTTREGGRIVRRIVRVVKRVVVPSTALGTPTRYATRPVTVEGQTRTISETRSVPAVSTRTRTAVVTSQRTVTATQVLTQEQTVTDTATQFRTTTDMQTVTQTTPAATVTTTLPAQTVTVIVTVTLPKH